MIDAASSAPGVRAVERFLLSRMRAPIAAQALAQRPSLAHDLTPCQREALRLLERPLHPAHVEPCLLGQPSRDGTVTRYRLPLWPHLDLVVMTDTTGSTSWVYGFESLGASPPPVTPTDLLPCRHTVEDARSVLDDVAVLDEWDTWMVLTSNDVVYEFDYRLLQSIRPARA